MSRRGDGVFRCGAKWGFALRLDTTERPRRQLLRRGFPREQDAQAAKLHVLMLVEEGRRHGDRGRRKVGDLVFDWPRNRPELPTIEEIRRLLGARRDPRQAAPTLGEWLGTWLRTKRYKKETSQVNWRHQVEAYLVPHLGDVPLDELWVEDLADMLDRVEARNEVIRECRAAGRSVPPDPRDPRKVHRVTGPAAQRHMFTTLSGALEAAVEAGYISRNPCRLRAARDLLPEVEEAEAAAWSADQVVTFLDHVRDDRLAPLLELVLLYGLRRGEACGLRWADLDLDTGRLAVRRQLVYLGGRVVESTPKTKRSRRELTLDPDTVAVLRQHRRSVARERLLAGEAYADRDLVFGRPDGSPTPPYEVTFRFQALAREAGLPVIKLHEARHTAATLGLRAGVSAKVMSQRLGHSSPAFTTARYQHVLAEMDAEAAAAVGALVPRRRAEETGS